MLEIGQYTQPEVSTLTFREIQAQYVFLTFKVQAQHGIHSLRLVVTIDLNFVEQRNRVRLDLIRHSNIPELWQYKLHPWSLIAEPLNGIACNLMGKQTPRVYRLPGGLPFDSFPLTPVGRTHGPPDK